jgi:hypothetical protein
MERGRREKSQISKYFLQNNYKHILKIKKAIEKYLKFKT